MTTRRRCPGGSYCRCPAEQAAHQTVVVLAVALGAVAHVAAARAVDDVRGLRTFHAVDVDVWPPANAEAPVCNAGPGRTAGSSDADGNDSRSLYVNKFFRSTLDLGEG